MLDKITCVILGSLIGAGVTYILMQKHCDEVINEEVRQMKEYYAAKSKKNDEPVSRKDSPQAKEEIPLDDNVVVMNKITNKPDREPVDYSKSEGKEGRNTLLITSERFVNEEPDYEKITLSFYEEDGVLADSFGDVVDVERSIGFKAVSYFNLLHQDVIYIRNTDLKIDYEIVLEHSSYRDEYETGFRDGKE